MRAETKYDLPVKRRANNNKTNETTVAVYLEKNNYRIRFIPAGVSFESDTSPGMKPVYVRMFSEFLLALGYYKVLCMLSHESIEQIISDSHSEADAGIAAPSPVIASASPVIASEARQSQSHSKI